MGLRKDDLKNSGPCPGIRHDSYRESCKEFLKIQIDTIKPSLIILLGFYPLKMMWKTFPDQFDEWRDIRTVRALCDEKKPKQVITTSINKQEITVAFVIHPSLNQANRSKVFGKGDEHKEVEYLKEKLSQVIEHTKMNG